MAFYHSARVVFRLFYKCYSLMKRGKNIKSILYELVRALN